VKGINWGSCPSTGMSRYGKKVPGVAAVPQWRWNLCSTPQSLCTPLPPRWHVLHHPARYNCTQHSILALPGFAFSKNPTKPALSSHISREFSLLTQIQQLQRHTILHHVRHTLTLLIEVNFLINMTSVNVEAEDQMCMNEPYNPIYNFWGAAPVLVKQSVPLMT